MYIKYEKICDLSTDKDWLDYAIKNDLIIFGLEAAKYPDAESLARGIEITIKQKKI